MPTKPTPPQDDPEQAKRFIETAKEIGAAETKAGAEKAFKQVAETKAPAPSQAPRR